LPVTFEDSDGDIHRRTAFVQRRDSSAEFCSANTGSLSSLDRKFSLPASFQTYFGRDKTNDVRRGGLAGLGLGPQGDK